MDLTHFTAGLAGATLALLTGSLFNGGVSYLLYVYPYLFGYLAYQSTDQTRHILTSLALGTVFTVSPFYLCVSGLVGGTFYLYKKRLVETAKDYLRVLLIEPSTVEVGRIDIPYYYDGIKYRVNLPITDKPTGLVTVTGKTGTEEWSRVDSKTYEYLGPHFDFLGCCPPKSVLNYHTISVKSRAQDQRYYPQTSD